MGIGTATPTEKLVVENDTNNQTYILMSNPNAGTSALAGLKLQNDGGGGVAFGFGTLVKRSSTYPMVASNSGGRHSLDLVNSDLAPLTLSTDNAIRMFIDSAGRVGIGAGWSVPPSSLLEVKGDFEVDDTDLFVNSAANRVGIGTNTPSSTLDVAGNFEVDGTDFFVNSASGNVGIGVIPSARLDILQDTNALVVVEITNTDVGSSASCGFKLSNNVAGMHGILTKNSSTNSNLGGFRSLNLTNVDAAPLTLGTRNGVNVFIDDSGHVGIGRLASDPHHDLQLFSDDAHKTLTSTWTFPSDSRVKQNISPFTDGLDIILQTACVWYQYNGLANTPVDATGCGIIAQDIQPIAPYVVDTFLALLNPTDTAETEILSINMHPYFLLMVNAVKELDSTNNALTSQVDSLITLLNDLLSSQGGSQMTQGEGGSDSRTAPEDQFPSDNSLNQNYPNPFNSITNIAYKIAQSGTVELDVYDLSGRYVIRLVDGFQEEGSYTIQWNSGNLTTGNYFYTLRVDGQQLVKKALVVK